MDEGVLKDIGLSDGEVKVYLALLKLGSSKSGPLIKVASVSSSKVYKILDRLEKKGLVGFIIKGKVKHFIAMKPNRILDYLEEKEARLKEKQGAIEQMLPELEKHYMAGKEKSNASLHVGFKAVTNLFRNILEELSPGERYYVIGGGYGDTPNLRQFFYGHHQRRRKKGVKVMMLGNYDVKDKLEETTKLTSEIRYLPHYLVTNMEIVFYKCKVFIALWTKEPVGFVIENEEAVKSFRKYFDMFWKTAKK